MDLDLAYAPPFSSVWDPVAVAAREAAEEDLRRWATPAAMRVLADRTLRGAALCRALLRRDRRVARRAVPDAVGDLDAGRVALVAVGGYGRAELAPASDLDVLLLHESRKVATSVRPSAERLWYPVWDASSSSVTRCARAGGVAAGRGRPRHGDVVPDARHLAGDAGLTAALADGAAAQWRKRAEALAGPSSTGRPSSVRPPRGEVAFLLEPDLKDGRGGLRDVHALRWAGRHGPRCWPTATGRRSATPTRSLLGGPGRAAPGHRAARRRPCPRRTRTRWRPGSGWPTPTR